MWEFVFAHARSEAVSKFQVRRKRFIGVRKFAEIAAKRKEEAATKARAEADEEESERRCAELEALRPRRSILQLLDMELPDVNTSVDIKEYAEEHFNLNRKGFFGAKTTVTKMLSWKNDVIKMSLLKLPSKDLEAQATQAFRNVMGFMGDRSSRKDESGHADKLLKMCLNSPAELRDEVYCQIIKQTSNNPDAESTRAGWQLLSIIAGAIAPSEDFKPYLLSYCAGLLGDAALGEFVRFTMGRVLKTIALGPRKEAPTIAEIEACRVTAPVLVRVFSLDGTFDMMPITSWTTSKNLCSMMCEKRGIVRGSAFGIFEMTPEGEERVLDSDERVLDVIAYWHRLFDEEKAKGEDAKSKKEKRKALGNNFYSFVFKVALYLELPVEDSAAQHQLYVQAVYDVVSARYPCGEDDSLALAGVLLQAECGDAGIPKLSDRLDRFLPAKYATGKGIDKENVAEKVTSEHKKHRGTSKVAAEKFYLHYIKDWQVYGSSFFFAEPQNTVDMPEEVFLAVNPKGVLVINPETKEVRRRGRGRQDMTRRESVTGVVC